MKNIALILLAGFLFLTGCAATPYTRQLLQLGDEKAAGVGDIFFKQTEGQAMKNVYGQYVFQNGTHYDLTIVELNEEQLGLQYTESFYEPSQFINIYNIKDGGWRDRPAASKRLNYSLADKIVRFKNAEFEITGFENGLLKYRRIK